MDMTEIIRRIQLDIYDHEEYEEALAWVKENCKEGRDREFLFIVAAFSIFLQNIFIAAVNFLRVEQEFLPVICQRHAPAAAIKQRNAQFLFQLFHSARQGWLGNIQKFGRLVQGFGLCYCDNVVELYQCHFLYIPFRLRTGKSARNNSGNGSAVWYIGYEQLAPPDFARLATPDYTRQALHSRRKSS